MPRRGCKQVTAWVSMENYETLQEIAGDLGVSMSEMGTRAVEHYVNFLVEQESGRKFAQKAAGQ